MGNLLKWAHSFDSLFQFFFSFLFISHRFYFFFIFSCVSAHLDFILSIWNNFFARNVLGSLIDWVFVFIPHSLSLSVIPLFLSDWLLERHRQTCVGPEWKCSVQWQLCDGEPDCGCDNHHGNVPSDCFNFWIVCCCLWFGWLCPSTLAIRLSKFHNLLSQKPRSHITFQLTIRGLELWRSKMVKCHWRIMCRIDDLIPCVTCAKDPFFPLYFPNKIRYIYRKKRGKRVSSVFKGGKKNAAVNAAERQ